VCCSPLLVDTAACLHCHLAQPSCGGPGEQPEPGVPRTLALVCNARREHPSKPIPPIACNTCAACCVHDHGFYSGLGLAMSTASVPQQACDACDAKHCHNGSAAARRLLLIERTSRLKLQQKGRG
jgi:hypothetical protein